MLIDLRLGICVVYQPLLNSIDVNILYQNPINDSLSNMKMIKKLHLKRAKITGRYIARGNKYKIQECPIFVAA